MSISIAIFDLVRLRGAFSEQFVAWDLAVEERNSLKAKRARRQIQRVAGEGLSRHPATLGGFYLFHDPLVGGLKGLNYIGIADSPRRPIGRRIEDRLKDDSALDVEFDHAEEDLVRGKIRARLLCALPKTGQNYVEKHLRVAALFRRSPAIILLGCNAPRNLIRDTEKVLIGSAAYEGAPLTNKTHLRYSGPTSREAMGLASAVVSAAGDAGFPKTGVDCWRNGLNCITLH